MLVGHCDGAIYMLDIIKKALPETTTFVENPAPSAPITFLVYSVFGSQHQKYGAHIPKVLICGEPMNISNHTGATLVIDCKKVSLFQPRQARICYIPFYVTSFGE